MLSNQLRFSQSLSRQTSLVEDRIDDSEDDEFQEERSGMPYVIIILLFLTSFLPIIWPPAFAFLSCLIERKDITVFAGFLSPKDDRGEKVDELMFI